MQGLREGARKSWLSARRLAWAEGPERRALEERGQELEALGPGVALLQGRGPAAR